MEFNMNIGILGGTFDPIHNAHISMAENSLNMLNLDKVLIMPSPCPPHKNRNNITEEYHRINMIKLAIEDKPNIELSDFEIKNNLYYTADTLTKLKQNNEDDDFYFIIGSDSLASFDSWYHPEIILLNARLIVVKRDDESYNLTENLIEKLSKKYNVQIILLKNKVSDISSTFIRCNNIELCKNLIDKKVYKYISDNHLYIGKINNTWSVIKIKEDLKRVLNKHRYMHTIGVADTAKIMAENYGVNPNKAYLAGLLHDCAKHLSDNELIKCCNTADIVISDYEMAAPYLLHAKVGAHIAKIKYNVDEEDILSAIRWHTTGRPFMSDLEKIIFCADYIEVGRTKQPNLEFLRKIYLDNLDRLTYLILKDTVLYLKCKSQIIDDNTLKAYQYYKNQNGE
jgi:nicotinate-nucleotide adenylyltransferase